MSTVPPEGPTDPASGPAVPPPPEQPAPPPSYGDPNAAPPYAAPPVYGQPTYGQPAYGAPAGAPLSPSDEQLWATLAHIGPIVLGFIAPLIIWLVFRERSRFVDDQAKEALNFQIMVTIAGIAVSIIGVVTLGIGFILYVGFILFLVWMIQGTIAANKGQNYRYPFSLRLIK